MRFRGVYPRGSGDSPFVPATVAASFKSSSGLVLISPLSFCCCSEPRFEFHGARIVGRFGVTENAEPGDGCNVVGGSGDVAREREARGVFVADIAGDSKTSIDSTIRFLRGLSNRSCWWTSKKKGLSLCCGSAVMIHSATLYC